MTEVNRMRDPDTIRARKPRKIEYCGNCGSRVMGYKEPKRDDKNNIISRGRCSKCKMRKH